MKSAPALGSLSPPPSPAGLARNMPGGGHSKCPSWPPPPAWGDCSCPGAGGGRGGDGEVAAGAQGLLQELSEGLLLRGRRASCSRTDLAG